MGIYVFDNDSRSFDRFSVVDNDKLVGVKTVTIEEYARNKTQDFRYMTLIEDVKFNGEKPIIYSKEKATAIFSRFFLLIWRFYVHPSIVDQEFIDWFVEKFPMDILRLPLEEIDYGMAYKALVVALHTLENTQKYSYEWFSIIFKDMPMKFKDEEMCIWASNNNPDLIKTFPSQYI